MHIQERGVMRKRKNDKTALVLAGGGLTGAVYEIGALRAIDDLLVDLTVNDFDIYVGTSAGALIASFLANGVAPEAMLRVLDRTNQDLQPLEHRHVFHLDRQAYLNWGLHLPKKIVNAWTQYLRHLDEMTLFDLIWSLTDVLPSGLYDSLGLQEFIHQALVDLGHSDDFYTLDRELYIIATELNTGNRAVFGPNFKSQTPISLAVAASSALPVVYTPVTIEGEEYVDGGLRGTASLDLAIERGAKLVVCINPLVPINTEQSPNNNLNPSRAGRLVDRGVPSIANQALRILSHAGLHYHIKQLRRSHPEVDIILIEPDPHDYETATYNIMRYSARLIVARHGFESVTINLAQEYPMFKEILGRHGIPITRRLVIEELKQITDSGNDPSIIQQVLEARSEGCGQSRRDTPICQLTRALAELEYVLDEMTTPVEMA
jgi:NTE family protein